MTRCFESPTINYVFVAAPYTHMMVLGDGANEVLAALRGEEMTYEDEWGEGEVECIIGLYDRDAVTSNDDLEFISKMFNERPRSYSMVGGVILADFNPEERAEIRKRTEYFAGNNALFMTFGRNRPVYTA